MPDKPEPAILVTGATGFVMSNTVRYLLETDPAARVIVLDLSPITGALEDFFAPVIDRVLAVQGDIRDRDLLHQISSDMPISHVIHAAALTHYGPWEQQNPAPYVDINVMGTVNLLEWARTLPDLQQFLYVSTGDVYGDPVTEKQASPQPEAGPFHPHEFYALTKWAAENIVRRYGELFGIPMPGVRLSSVFGPMERPTSGRVTMSLVFYMMRAVIEGRPFRTSESTLQAGGDYISAEEIARAIATLIRAKKPRHDAYNIADGTYTPVTELLSMFKEIVPSFSFEAVSSEQADWQRDPANRYARWDAYTSQRLHHSTNQLYRIRKR